MAVSGVVRAEGASATSVVTGDKFVVQRYQSNANGAYWTPLEATVDELAMFAAGSATLKAVALGTATLAAGTVTVTLATITAAALVFATEQGTGALAISVTVSAGASFTLTSSSNADTSIVNYIVYDV